MGFAQFSCDIRQQSFASWFVYNFCISTAICIHPFNIIVNTHYLIYFMWLYVFICCWNRFFFFLSFNRHNYIVPQTTYDLPVYSLCSMHQFHSKLLLNNHAMCVFAKRDILFNPTECSWIFIKVLRKHSIICSEKLKKIMAKNRKRKRLFARVNRQSIDECIRVKTFLNKYLYINVRKCTAWM